MSVSHSVAHCYEARRLEEGLRGALASAPLLKKLDAALAGDTTSAFLLCVAAPPEYLGSVAVLLYLKTVLGETSREAYATYLEALWQHGHVKVIAASGCRQRLRAMFRHAGFELPNDWPDTIRIWRGTAGVSVDVAKRGIAWTINRDIACWFAMGSVTGGRQPVVLTADVPRTSILHYSNARAEQEAICIDIASAVIDGSEEDWQAGSVRYSQFLQERREHILAFINGKID